MMLWFVVFMPPLAVLGGEDGNSDKVVNHQDPVRIDVDATQIARHLLTSQMRMTVTPGQMALWFPEWIPGIHGPGEQIRNMGGLKIFTADGTRIAWRRDDRDLYKFSFDVPEGVSEIRVELTYIANQPTRTSVGVDSMGNSDLAVINPNTCLLYPDGIHASELQVAMRVKFPPAWHVASALKHDRDGDWYAFQTTTLEHLIDSPVVAGRHAKTIRIATESFPVVYLQLISESPSALRLSDERTEQYHRLVAEAATLFGSAPFDEYHLLVTCSDRIPWMGLEHLASSLNGVAERAMVEDDKHKNWPAYLLPHEFVHAWCGKYRRPAGMVTDDYHHSKKTSQLWIYEGLTQYLGEVLSVRAGLVSYADYRDRLARKFGSLANRAGCQWRSLEDTAIAGHTLRGGSRYWNDLRRDQDYYNEGALFWMETDAIIREKTRDQLSLDDFCRQFFRHQPETDRRVIPYELAEVIDTLNALAPYDWAGLIRRRIGQPHDQLPAEVLQRVGHRIKYVPDRPEQVKKREEDRKTVSAVYSIGMAASNEGKITHIVPDGLCDRAGLAQRMKIIGVNDREFSPQRLRDALADSTTTRVINFLILDGETFRTITVPYADGPRYITLVPNPDREDRLKAIFAAQVAKSKTDSSNGSPP